MTEWIDINERKPELGKSVLVNTKRTLFSVAVMYLANPLDSDEFVWCFESGRESFVFDFISHWMPLPEPPKKVRWKPKDGEACWVIESEIHGGDECRVFCKSWLSISTISHSIRDFLGVYRTKEEAEVMREKIAAFVSKEIGEVE